MPPLRFAAAQPPVQETAVQDAAKEGPICLSANNPEGLQFNSPRQFMAEDCLFVAVYAPANATEASNLPVMLFISGGGFNSNSNANFNGTSLVENSGMNMIVVRANYRVGILGFVAGTLVEADKKGAVSNNGLKDMVAAARWIKQFISKFGGNPNHIVINGDSSGGNAIDILLAANGGVGFPDLFVGAIAESTGWGSEGQIVSRDDSLKKQLAATGCDAKPDPIDCLRTLPIGELQARLTKDGFGPTIEGNFLTAPHYQLYEAGKFQKIPTIYGYASDEATPEFISNNTVNTTDEVLNDIRGDVGASMSDAEIAQIAAAYPETLNSRSFFGRNMIARNASIRKGTGQQWQRDAAIETELKLHCVAAFFSDMFADAGQPTFAYRYNILDETPGGSADVGLFSPHTSELYAVWGLGNTDGGDPGCLKLNATDPLSCTPGALATQAYWISFVRTLDPNAFKLANAPAWPAWTIATPNRISFDNDVPRLELMGAANGEVPISGMNQRQRCLSLTLPLAKRMNIGLQKGETLPAFANGSRTDPTAVVLASQPITPVVPAVNAAGFPVAPAVAGAPLPAAAAPAVAAPAAAVVVVVESQPAAADGPAVVPAGVVVPQSAAADVRIPAVTPAGVVVPQSAAADVRLVAPAEPVPAAVAQPLTAAAVVAPPAAVSVALASAMAQAAKDNLVPVSGTLNLSTTVALGPVTKGTAVNETLTPHRPAPTSTPTRASGASVVPPRLVALGAVVMGLVLPLIV